MNKIGSGVQYNAYDIGNNRITIFKYEGDQKWVVDETFELSQF